LSHPDIVQAAVHGVPAALTEDEVKVVAVLRTGAALSEAQLWHWCVDRVPRFAIPRFIEFRAELPVTPSGRIQKFALRSEGVTAATWDCEALKDLVDRRSLELQK
jgi:crotonobetaine/carnitine-CoA ligase